MLDYTIRPDQLLTKTRTTTSSANDVMNNYLSLSDRPIPLRPMRRSLSCVDTSILIRLPLTVCNTTQPVSQCGKKIGMEDAAVFLVTLSHHYS